MAVQFTPAQYEFIVRRMGRAKSPSLIVAEFSRAWKSPIVVESDLRAFVRDKLPEGWHATFDEERIALLAAPLTDPQVRVAVLSEFALEQRDRNSPAEMLKAIELIEKIQGGFFRAKAAPDEGDKGASSFTFGLDRAEQN